MPDPLRDRVIATFGEAYDVGLEVGRGGMGVVYRATDKRLRRDVAIKVLPPELAYRDDVRQRFLREAQTAAQLSHPNIVPIFSVEEQDGLVCFVMALVDGESLATRIARDRRMAIADVINILLAVAEALGYAHSRGIVHRDIKPDNVLLERATGRAMVTDFGIARAAEGDARLTVTGIAVGTPAYMSPEQAMGDKDIDGRSDLYSLAIVGYQMLAGELPFHASNTPGMLMKHISELARPIGDLRSDAPQWLVEILERAMAKKAVDRFADAATFCAALRDGGTSGGAKREEQRLSSAWKHAIPPKEVVARASLDVGVAFGARRSEEESRQLPVSPKQRSAIDAANPMRRGSPNDGSAPLPPWMPPSWRDARRGWGDVDRGPGARVRRFDRLPVVEKIHTFRRKVANSLITILMLAAINVFFSPGFFWFLFPAFGMMFGLARNLSSLFDDGVRLDQIYGPKAQEMLAKRAEGISALPSGQPAARPHLAPADVLAGPHGGVVTRAEQDRESIHLAVSKLSKADRELIPDVLPTVDALAERVGSLALALHRLDEDVRPGTMEDVERRILMAKGQPESKERDQKVALLERQLATMKDLAGRRDSLVAQIESASLMLQNMGLDLIALRSAGLQSVINDVGSATQEARALSREIANALAAAKEVR